MAEEGTEITILKKAYYFLVNSVEIFKEALMMLIDDDGFSLSDKARRALLCAHKLLQYELVPQNKKTASDFLIHLQDCLKHPRKVTLRERIWERYYKYRSSDEFKVMWREFLQKTIGFEACPIFYQYITDKILETLLKNSFKVQDVSSKEQPLSLDFEEANALRWIC